MTDDFDRSRYMLAKQAAKKLNVSVEVIEGLVRARKIDGAKTYGKSGAEVWMVSKEAVRELAQSEVMRLGTQAQWDYRGALDRLAE